MTPPFLGPSINRSTTLLIFNYLGASLIFFGVAFFISMNWNELNTFFRITCTLGVAILAFLLGWYFHLHNKKEITSSAFFMLSALLFPIGFFVTFDVMNIADTCVVNLLVAILCFTIFLLGHLFAPRTLLLLFSIIYATFLYWTLLACVVDQTGFDYYLTKLYYYHDIALGASFLLLGRYLDLEKTYHPLSGPLYLFGALLILSATFWLGGYAAHAGITPWKIANGFILFFAFFLAIPLQSKAVLYVAAIFFVIYILDLSSYFLNTLGHFGWPLMLILAGLLLMFTGYLVFNIHKKMMHIKFD